MFSPVVISTYDLVCELTNIDLQCTQFYRFASELTLVVLLCSDKQGMLQAGAGGWHHVLSSVSH